MRATARRSARSPAGQTSLRRSAKEQDAVGRQAADALDLRELVAGGVGVQRAQAVAVQAAVNEACGEVVR
jgi:hypothetical protein